MSLWKDKQKEYNMKSLVKLINESNYGPFGAILDYNYLCLYLMFEYFTRNQKAKNDLVKMFNQNKSKLKPDLVKWFESEFDDFLDDWEDELSEYAENDLMEE